MTEMCPRGGEHRARACDSKLVVLYSLFIMFNKISRAESTRERESVERTLSWSLPASPGRGVTACFTWARGHCLLHLGEGALPASPGRGGMAVVRRLECLVPSLGPFRALASQ